MTISLALNEFLTTQKLRYNSKHTLDSYQWQLSPFLQYTSDLDVSFITLDLCNRYKLSLRENNLTSASCQSYCRALRVFLKWMYEENYITENISARFSLPKAKRKIIDTLTDDEINRLFQCDFQSDSVKLRNGCLVSLMLDSGLRLSEAVSLQRSRVYLRECYCCVDGKGGKQRIVPLGGTTRAFLERYMAQVDTVGSLFVLNNRQPLTVDAVKDVFRKLKKESRIDRLRPHLLRHTFATRYLQNGGDLFKLQRILGHTSIEMTKRYLHLSSNFVCADFEKYSPLSYMAKNGRL